MDNLPPNMDTANSSNSSNAPSAPDSTGVAPPIHKSPKPRKTQITRRSHTRRVFFCWLYAQAINPGEKCDLHWICESLGLSADGVDVKFLDDLMGNFTATQQPFHNFLDKFLDEEYPSLDMGCATILLCLLVERTVAPDMAAAIVIDETINLAHEFSPDGYQVINALAEKLWLVQLPDDLLDPGQPPTEPPDHGATGQPTPQTAG